MNVIKNSNGEILGFLGGPQRRMKDFKYRFNKFIIKTDKNEEGESIWYNTLTGAIISIKDFEEPNIFIDMNRSCDYVNFLYENYFLVPEQFNEDELIAEYRRRKQILINANSLTRLTHFTVLTTTKCNARCFYCYQMHNKGKQHMTVETAHKVADYIIDSTVKDQDIWVGWFGGEPLYNKDVIDIINTRVRGAGRMLHCSMISNGYLFDETICKKAVKDWGLKNIQVTLDGTEEIYNETKNYIYKDDPSPFKRIINNIHTMLKYEIYVSIRMNVGLHNVENLKELIKYLAVEFKDEPYFSMYIHELFEDNRDEEEGRQIFDNMQILNNAIVEAGSKSVGADISEGIRTIHCMVDDGGSVVIMPDGRLGLCEHYEHDHYIGHIDEPGNIDLEEVKIWREAPEYEEICEDCPYKPACLKCKLCPDHNICKPYEREYVLSKIKKDLQIIYDDWAHVDQPESCSCGRR